MRHIFYSSQRLGKLRCRASIAIDSSGIVTAGWMVGCGPRWLACSHRFWFCLYALRRSQSYQKQRRCCLWITEAWESACVSFPRCACVDLSCTCISYSSTLGHLLPFRELWSFTCLQGLCFSHLHAMICHPITALTPGVNPQLQVRNQTHLFMLPRGSQCRSGVQVHLRARPLCFFF